MQYSMNIIETKEEYQREIVDKYIGLYHTAEEQTRFKRSCDYMFHDLGFIIFVAIVNGKIETFRQVANTTEEKPFSKSISTSDIDKFEKNAYWKWFFRKMSKRSHALIRDKRQWVRDGRCYMIYSKQTIHGHPQFYFNILYNMISFVFDSAKKKLSKCSTCFFVNVFDSPVVHKGSDFIPVFSPATTNQYDDVCMIYPDAWLVISGEKFIQNKYHINKPNMSVNPYKGKTLETHWENKNNAIVFRGRNTSCYPNDPEKNDRLKVLGMFKNGLSDYINSLGVMTDVGLVEHTKNIHLRKENGKDVFNASDEGKIHSIIGAYKEPIPMAKQSLYKLILDIDGYVTPWRLLYELSYNSAIILIVSDLTSWFYDKLVNEENIFMIHINDPDIDIKIVSVIKRCKENDWALAKKVASGATQLFDKIATKKHVVSYMSQAIIGFCNKANGIVQNGGGIFDIFMGKKKSNYSGLPKYTKRHLPTVQVVISRYNENDFHMLLPMLPSAWSIVIYNKGPNKLDIPPNELHRITTIPLLNVGREGHTYLHHIIENYNNLFDVTLFIPASALDDSQYDKSLKFRTVVDTVRYAYVSAFPSNEEPVDLHDPEIYNFERVSYVATNKNNKDLNPQSKTEKSRYRPYGKWYEHVFKEPGYIVPDKIALCWHGIFAVQKKHILQRSIMLYKDLISYVDTDSNPEAGHFLERSYTTIFYPFPKYCLRPHYK